MSNTTKRIKGIAFLIFLLISATTITEIKAQKEANVWWFGYHAGIDFNTTPPTALTGNAMFTYEGSATISDPATGALIFATDGQSVWYPNGTTVVNGTGLYGATSSTQSALIVPNPSNANQWFLFTANVSPSNGTSRGTNYYVVDRAGSVITVGARTNLLGTTTSTEQLAALGDGAGGYWVLAHGVSSNTFYAYNVTSAGVVNTTPVTSSIGSSYGGNYISSMKANTCQTKIATTVLNAGTVEVFSFDNTTGSVTGVLYSKTGITNVYGLEFSPNDTYLYAGTLDGIMYQMDLATGTMPATTWTAPPNGTGKFGQLQLAPDNKIYIASEETGSTANIGVISSPDNFWTSASYSPTGFVVSTVNTTVCQLGLPTFRRTFVSAVAGVTPGTGIYCINTAIQLGYTFTGGGENSFTWTATGGGQTFSPSSDGGVTSNSPTPTVTFSTTGNKVITMTFKDVCNRTYTKTMTFTITNPKTPAGTVTCTSTGFTLDNPASDPDEPNYIWYKNSVSPSNIIGVGTPLTYSAGSNSAMPGNICVGISSTNVTQSTVTNHSIASSNPLTSAAYAFTPYTSPRIDVLASSLLLKSFRMGFVASGTISYTVTIKLGATTVYTQTYSNVSVTGGALFNQTVNTTLLQGNNYTITVSSTPTNLTLQSSEWLGATNAGEIFYSNSTPANGYTGAIANLIYDATTFGNITPTCTTPICYAVSCPLPVDLLYFTGKNAGSKNILNWASISETNNSYFEIQRSTDGINFTTIGTVKGNGNTNSIHEYEFTDWNPEKGTNYYKYIQHDYNGLINYSPIIKIGNTNSGASFTVSPNPSTSNFKVNFLDLTAGEFNVIDVLGKILLTQKIEAGTESIFIGSEFAKGAYVLKLSDSNGVSTQLVIKE